MDKYINILIILAAIGTISSMATMHLMATDGEHTPTEATRTRNAMIPLLLVIWAIVLLIKVLV